MDQDPRQKASSTQRAPDISRVAIELGCSPPPINLLQTVKQKVSVHVSGVNFGLRVHVSVDDFVACRVFVR